MCASRGTDVVVDVIVKAVYHRLEKHVQLLESPLVGPKKWSAEVPAEVLLQLALNQASSQKLLGINGMGGIGKTTLTTAVFNATFKGISRRCTFLHVGADCTTYGALSVKHCKLLKNLTVSNVPLSYPSPHQERNELRHILASGDPLLRVPDDL